WIAYLRKDAGRTQAWRSRVDGQGEEQLTHNEGDVRQLTYSRDGSRLLYETEPTSAEIASSLLAEGKKGFLYDRRFFPSYSTSPTLPWDASVEASRATEKQKRARRIWAYDFAS